MQHGQLRNHGQPLKTCGSSQGVASNLRIMLQMGAEVEGTLPAAKLADLLHVYLKARRAANRLFSVWCCDGSPVLCHEVATHGAADKLECQHLGLLSVPLYLGPHCERSP